MTAPERNALAELVARLEAAREGSRELDAEIDVFLLDKGWREMRYVSGWPHYTTSIDVALALLKKGWDWQVSLFRQTIGVCRAQVWPGALGDLVEWDAYSAYAPTPALALCIAALKARGASQ